MTTMMENHSSSQVSHATFRDFSLLTVVHWEIQWKSRLVYNCLFCLPTDGYILILGQTVSRISELIKDTERTKIY